MKTIMQKTVFKAIILLILLCAFSFTVYKDIKITNDTMNTRAELKAEGHLSKEEKKLIDEWYVVRKKRIMNYGMTIVWYVIVFSVVLSVGPARQKTKRVSKAEAKQIMMSLEEEYRRKGIYVDKNDEEEEEIELLPDSLDTPRMISAEFKDDAIEVVWEPVLYADGYTIYRKTTDSKWKRIGRAAVGNTSYMDYALRSNVKYIYSVKAFLISEDKRIISKKDPLGKEAVSRADNMPDIPEIFAVEESGKKGIGWKPIDGARTYRVFRTRNGKKWKQIARVLASEDCKYFVEDNLVGERYRYAVSAAVLVNKHPVIGEHDENGIVL